MTAFLVLLSIVVGAALFGGGIMAGVWIHQVALNGWPKPTPKVVAPTNGVPPAPVYETVPVEPPPFRPPAAKRHEGTPFRYDAQSELESSRNFELMRERLAAQQGNPFAEAYEGGTTP